MNHDTSYRPDWAMKMGGATMKKKPAKKKKSSMMDYSAKMGKGMGKGK